MAGRSRKQAKREQHEALVLRRWRVAASEVFGVDSRPAPSRLLQDDELWPRPQPIAPISHVRSFVRRHRMLAASYRCLKWIYKFIMKERVWALFVAPAVATGLIRGGLLWLFDYMPDIWYREVGFDAIIFCATALLVVLSPYFDMLKWLRSLSQIKHLTKDAERPLLVHMVTTQLENIRTSFEEMLRGDLTPDPPQLVSSYFQTFFAHGGPNYVGIDSHAPNDYLENFDWFLSVHSIQIARNKERTDRRVIVARKRALTDFYISDAASYLKFVRWHNTHGVGLFYVDPDDVRTLRQRHGIPEDLDIAIWDNYAVTFAAQPDERFKLAITFPGERSDTATSWESLREFVSEVLEVSREFTLRPPGLDVVDREMAEAWPEYVGVVDRTSRDGGLARFLQNVLPPRATVLDTAAGIGCESSLLLSTGFGVVSNEVDANFATLAESFAKSEFNLELDLRRHLWQELAKDLKGNLRFDALLCLGNSLCLVEDSTGRKSSVQSFFKLLRPDAVLVIDERNFRYMLDHREELMRAPSTFPALTRDPMYSGKSVRGFPIAIDDQSVSWTIFRPAGEIRSVEEISVRAIGKPLFLHPFGYGELLDLLQSVGFHDIDIYADLRLVGRDEMPQYGAVENAMFFTYVARHPPVAHSARQDVYSSPGFYS